MTVKGPLNSTIPPNSDVVGGVFNSSAPSPADGQPCALQLDAQGNLKTTGAGSGLSNVNIADVLGNPPALTNPLPVELSDGTNALGTSTNPLRDGPFLRGSTTVPTAVSDGALVAARSDKYGNQIALLNAPRELIGSSVVSNNSATSAASLIGAGNSGVFNDIITLIMTNRSATASVVSLTDGTVTYTFAIAANGGLVCNFPTPLPATSTATAWTIGNSAAVAFDYVTVYNKAK
jgi:hypothetical protein